MRPASLLLAAWREPAVVAGFDHAAWNRLLREVRVLGLEARLSFRLEAQGLAAACPPPAWAELCAQRHLPALLHAQVRFEVRKVLKALAATGIPLLLLKGGGYVHAALPVARGRGFTDLDVLVPAAELGAAEAALLAAGWQHMKADAYDQRYYRRWMHELPPLYHPERGLVIDVHHAILPPTNRLHPAPALLWADSLALARAPLRVLAPADMVLHSAAHLFADGEIRGGLGNLLDLDLLLRDFGQAPGFWQRLPERARQLGLGRPLWYALRYCERLLGTPVPAAMHEATRAFAPVAPVRWLMDRLVPPVLTPHWPVRRPAGFAAWLLYLRSHWLRMPPGLLAAHLGRKALRRVGVALPGGDEVPAGARIGR